MFGLGNRALTILRRIAAVGLGLAASESDVFSMKVHPSQRGFTLIELLVVISIIALLVAMLMPALGQARNAARTVNCASNLHNWGIALNTYAHDHFGWFPPMHKAGGVATPDQQTVAMGTLLAEGYGLADGIQRCPTQTARQSDGSSLWGDQGSHYQFGYAMLTGYDLEEPGGHVPATPGVEAGKFGDVAANLDSPTNSILAVDILFKRNQDWLDTTNEQHYLITAHRNTSLRPDGGHTLFMDGSVTWFDAGSVGATGQGVDTMGYGSDYNYDLAGSGSGAIRSYYWGRAAYR